MNARYAQSRGFALLVVVAVVALASVLGFVMLSAATLQTRASANQGRLTSADYLAESGVNIAMYYLQYPENAPGYPSFGGLGYWGGTGGQISIADDVDGTVEIAVTRDADDMWSYEIVSTARAGKSSQTQLTKTTGARVYVRNEYVVNHAGAFNGSTILQPYMSFSGDVWSAKSFSLRSAAPAPTVSGTIYCRAISPTGWGYQTPTNVAAVPTDDFPAPTTSDNGLNKYATYVIDDVTYSRATISDSGIDNVTLGPTGGNPAGIYYKSTDSGGEFQIDDFVTINGTLIVDGSVRIRGANIVINAQDGFPGLIVTGNLTIEQPLNSLTVNGLCYVGGQLRTNTTSTPPYASISRLTINGALLMGTTGLGNIMNGYNIITTVIYDAEKVKAPDLTANYRVATGVSIVRWGLP